MSNPEPVINNVLAPLEDRVFELVSEMPFFTFKHLRPLFPDDSDKTLYRVLNKLEESNRIRFLHYQSKQKVYTAAGVSKLPILRSITGKQVDLNEFFKSIDMMYDEDGNFRNLHKMNDLPIQFCRLFLFAELDKSDWKRNWTEFMNTMVAYREQLQVFIGYIDSVTKHPGVKGDYDYFMKTFGGDEAPNPQQLTDFKVWYTRKFINKVEAKNNEPGND